MKPPIPPCPSARLIATALRRLAALCLGLSLSAPGGAVPLPYHDSFAYAEGRLNDVGAPVWFAGSTGTELSVASAAALSAPEGSPAASGHGLRRAPSGTARRSVLQYTSVPAVEGNTMYASFLLNVQSPPASAQLIGFLDNNSSSQGAPQAGVFLDAGPRLGIGKKSSAPAFTMATNLATGTHLVVVGYSFQAGNDRVDVWVDPPAPSYGAGAPPPPLGSATGGSDPASLDYFQLYSSPSAGGVQFIDELRLGTSWADVVPLGAPPVGEKLGFTSQPTWAAPGAIMNPVVVQVQSAGGSAVASNGVLVTLTLTSGSGTLGGTTTRATDAAGRAIFDDLSIDQEGNDKQLTASASGPGAGLAPAVSSLFAISTAPPVTDLCIAETRLLPDGLVLSALNGTPNARYNVLASPDLNLPLSEWMVSTVGFFDAAGRCAATNPVSPALPRQFYRLLDNTPNTKIVPPSITRPPVSQTVSPGSTVTFTVQAVGPLLHYLWYFNGRPMAGATASMLTITNASPEHVGSYHVVVANGAGAATSSPATLRVGYFSPCILTQPQDQTVGAGGTAVFSVAADGTQPLSYQWYHNEGTPLPDATNATLTLLNVTTNQTGSYRVVVANQFGSLASSNALLTVTPIPTAPPVTNLMGYAALANVTGGDGGQTVIATNYAALRAYARAAAPLVILLTNVLTSTETYTYVYGHNKTFRGVGTNAGLLGTLRINATNIIVQNLWFSSADNDGISVDYSSSSGAGRCVWIDHCTFEDCGDGSVDITKGADYVTVSWCRFIYPSGRSHAYANLLGSSDTELESLGKLHVTFCFNWYGSNCLERMPSVRFGRVHAFNNYYDCAGNNYCVRTRLYAQVLLENNYFLNVQNPWERLVTSAGGDPGLLRATGNITNHCTWVAGWYPGVVLIPGDDTLSDLDPPPYAYTLIPASDVPYYVRTYAGAGRYPYVEPSP